MNKYLFFLGHQPHISTAEIQAVFSAKKIPYKIEFVKNNNLLILTDISLDAENLITRLGGIVKIAEQIDGTTDNKKNIIRYLQKAQPAGKINFSLTGDNAKQVALEIKKELKNLGRNARYIEIKNTASILHNNLVKKQGDFLILRNHIYITRAIQPFEDFAERDFGRPETDSKSGMLPPKLAKIMINLTQTDKKSIILDPFCGSGTILMEAALLGYKNIIGSDISQKALLDSDKNLNWLKEKNSLTDLHFQLFLTDAAKIDSTIKKNSVDTIVSEPYLGRPLHGNETEKFLQNQAQQLSELYTEAFIAFHKILKRDGTIIFIIPSFVYKDDWVKIDCVEKIKKIGFETIPFSVNEIPLQYYRPGQKLARDIWRFKKTK